MTRQVHELIPITDVAKFFRVTRNYAKQILLDHDIDIYRLRQMDYSLREDIIGIKLEEEPTVETSIRPELSETARLDVYAQVEGLVRQYYLDEGEAPLSPKYWVRWNGRLAKTEVFELNDEATVERIASHFCRDPSRIRYGLDGWLMKAIEWLSDDWTVKGNLDA